MRHPISLTALTISLTLLGGCNGRAELEGAEVQIPMYAPSRLEDTSQAWTSDDPANIMKFREKGWTVSSPDDWQRIDQFYTAQPGFSRDDGDDPADFPHPEDQSPETPGQIVYRHVPADWAEGEGIWVTLLKDHNKDSRTELHIAQHRLNLRN